MSYTFPDGSSANGSLQWWVVSRAGLATITYNTGGGDTTETMSAAWQIIDDYMDDLISALNIDASLNFSWAWADVDGERRIQITSDPGDPSTNLTLTATQRALLGYDPGVLGFAPGAVSTGDSLPHGYVDVAGVHWSEPEPVKELHAQSYRHGRGYCAPWGSGSAYEVTIWCHRAQLDAILGGCLSVGRVRYTDGSPGSAHSSTAPEGWIDGYPYEVRRVRWLDSVENLAELVIGVMVPAASDRTTDVNADNEDGDVGFWDLLRYGFGVAHYCRIEGIPRIFQELDLGWNLSGYDIDETLIIDDSGRVGWRIDRQRGVSAGHKLNFGILDPTNTSGLFARGTTYTLAADVDASSTHVDVNESIAGAPSSGDLYIGKELIQYTGKSGARFTGVDTTRGDWGPIYTYRVEAVQSFRSVATWPRYWTGRFVELWAALLDPWGNPQGTAYDGGYTRQVFLGELAGSPAPNGGRWDFAAHSLERRLTRQVGVTSLATLAGRLSDDPREILVHVDATWAYLTTELTEYTYFVSDGPHESQFIGTTGTYTLEEVVHAILGAIATDYFPGSHPLWLQSQDYTEEDDGTVTVTILCGVVSAGTVSFWAAPTLAPSVSPDTIYSDLPLWTDTLWGVVQPEGTTITLTLRPRAPTKAGFWYARVIEPAQEDWGNAALPAAGYLLIDGDEKELVRYDQKTLITGGVDNAYRMRVTARQVGGTARADLTQRDVECRGGVLLEAPPAEVLLTVLESSGLDGTPGDRGTYDTLAIGEGYGLGTDYVDEGSIVSLGASLALTGYQSVVLTDRYSVEDLFGGMLAAWWCQLTMVRSGRRLKIGMVNTRPWNGLSDYHVQDAHMLSRGAAEVRDTQGGPVAVTAELAESSLIQTARRVTMRSTEASMAHPGDAWTLPFHGLSPSAFMTVLPPLLRAILDRAEILIGVKLRVGPWFDYLPGDAIRVTSTHPNLWDYDAGALGVTDRYARVLGVDRDLLAGTVTLALLMDGASQYGVLCPGVLITGVAGATLTVAAGDDAHFDPGENAIIYTPGQGSEWTTVTIDSTSSGSIVLTGAAPGWATADETRLTYPDEGSGSTRQDAYVHEDDGTVWG